MKIRSDILVIGIFVVVVGTFFVFRYMPGVRAQLFGSGKQQQMTQTRTQNASVIAHDGGEGLDVSFLQHMQERDLPTLREALQKRHFDAKIQAYDSGNFLRIDPVVVDDFYKNDGTPNTLLIKYFYRYHSQNNGVYEYNNGSVNYCATIFQDKNKLYHLILERRINNVENCAYENPKERFEYLFLPSRAELRRSQHKIMSKIADSRRNKDLANLTEDDIRRIEEVTR